MSQLDALYSRYNKLKNNRRNIESRGVLRKIQRKIRKLEKEQNNG
jgi:uncharacterized coiled-coil DUF342 family protein